MPQDPMESQLSSLYGGQAPPQPAPSQASPAPNQDPITAGLLSLYKPQEVQEMVSPSPPSPPAASALQVAGAGVGSFIAASPIGQAYSGLKNLGEGALNYAGKLMNGGTMEDPITYTIHHGLLDPAATAVQSSVENLKKLPSDFKAEDYHKAFSDAVGGIPLAGPMMVEAGNRLGDALGGYYDPKTNSVVMDPVAVSDAVGHAAGTVLSALALSKSFSGSPGEALQNAPEKLLNKARQATEYVVDKATTKAKPSDLMMGALGKDAPKRLDFGKQLDDLALPAIKEASDITGRKFNGLDSLIRTDDQPGLLDVAKQRAQEKINAIEGPRKAMGKRFDSSQLAGTIRDQITDTMRRQKPSVAKKLGKMANRYESASMGVDDMYDELTNLNATLDAYYAKTPAARKLAASANPDIAVEDALARNVRDQLYAWEEDPTVGQGLRTARQQYGALKQLENSLYQRRLTLQRSAPMDLSEKLSKWSGTSGIAKGVIKASLGTATGHGGLAISGVADVAGGAAKIAAGKWLENYTSTDALINRAFSKGIKSPPHIEVPPPFQPAGLLERGSIRVPGVADDSGPTGKTPQPGAGISPSVDWTAPHKGLLSENPATASGKRVTINSDKFNVQPPKGRGVNRLLGEQTMSHAPGEVQELVPIRDRATGKIIYVPKNAFSGYLAY